MYAAKPERFVPEKCLFITFIAKIHGARTRHDSRCQLVQARFPLIVGAQRIYPHLRSETTSACKPRRERCCRQQYEIAAFSSNVLGQMLPGVVELLTILWQLADSDSHI